MTVLHIQLFPTATVSHINCFFHDHRPSLSHLKKRWRQLRQPEVALRQKSEKQGPSSSQSYVLTQKPEKKPRYYRKRCTQVRAKQLLDLYNVKIALMQERENTKAETADKDAFRHRNWKNIINTSEKCALIQKQKNRGKTADKGA